MSSGRALVTGGFGFIGSAVVRALVGSGYAVTNLDVLTYAGSEARLAENPEVSHIRLDVRDVRLESLVEDIRPDVIVHLAAETHVTRSELNPQDFFSVNVDGTKNVLRAAAKVDAIALHVSTDEVYGSSDGKAFSESEKPHGEGNATSAYARSKALADDWAVSASANQPIFIVRPTNCFGPWQHPEKAIPRWITRGLSDQPLPVWGDGLYVRDWMYVDDAAAGIQLILKRGELGEVYNLGPGLSAVSNLEIARAISVLAGGDEARVVLTDYDRPSHDRMYAVATDKVRSLGWEGGRDLRAALRETVEWYRQHQDWWRPLLEDAEEIYDDEEPRST